jgi:hypothetical protein
MLRQGTRGIPRHPRVWLHPGGQAIRPDQEERPPLQIPEVAPGLGGGGVWLSTPPREAPAPLGGGPTSHSPGPGRSPATDALPGSPICLACSGDQPPKPSLASVEVLRSPRHDREERSPTARRLSLGKNSLPTMGSPRSRSFKFCCSPSTWCMGSKGCACPRTFGTPPSTPFARTF